MCAISAAKIGCSVQIFYKQCVGWIIALYANDLMTGSVIGQIAHFYAHWRRRGRGPNSKMYIWALKCRKAGTYVTYPKDLLSSVFCVHSWTCTERISMLFFCFKWYDDDFYQEILKVICGVAVMSGLWPDVNYITIRLQALIWMIADTRRFGFDLNK